MISKLAWMAALLLIAGLLILLVMMSTEPIPDEWRPLVRFLLAGTIGYFTGGVLFRIWRYG